MRRQATPELNLKDSAARSLIDSCPERKRVHLPAAVGDGIRGNPTRITAILTDQWALHDPVVLARCLGRPRSRRRGHPPSRILRRPAGLDASVGPALTALFVAERDFLPGEDAPWVDEIRHQLTELRLRALECYAAAGLGLDGTDSARACATSSASHPAQQPASSTSGSSPQPDAVRKPTRYSARNRQPGQCER